MPYVFTHAEYANMVFFYGFCNGNALAACREYSLQFPNHRVPDSRVFAGLQQTASDWHFPGVTFLLNVQTNKMWVK